MKRLVIALLAMMMAAGAALGFGAVAWADAGPHGNYLPNTDKCAGCHRAHTAIGDELLVASDSYALCTSCHNGTGATTNVVDGLLEGTGKRLNGGGFVDLPMLGYPGDAAGIVVEPVTSTHAVEGLGGGSGLGTAWGSLGPSGDGPGVQGVLQCTSCHNPHGSTNYRILTDADNGYGAPTTWLGDTYLNPWTNDQVLETDNLIAAGGVDKYATGNYANYTEGMAFFCADCHTEYLQPSSHAGVYNPSAPYDAGDGNGSVPRYRHAVVRTAPSSADGILRRAAYAPTSWTDLDGDTYWDPGEPVDETPSVSETTRTGFTCLTCHFAHGTAAQATGWAADVAPTDDSALLYYDNRGVCRVCHQQDK